MSSDVRLRDVREADLGVFFEQQLDAEANFMAAFTAKDPADREAFDAKWGKILADEAIRIRAILYGEQVAGHIVSHGWFGEPEVSYWLGKEFWGRGIATAALGLFLVWWRYGRFMRGRRKIMWLRSESWKSVVSRFVLKTGALPTRAGKRWMRLFCDSRINNQHETASHLNWLIWPDGTQILTNFGSVDRLGAKRLYFGRCLQEI